MARICGNYVDGAEAQGWTGETSEVFNPSRGEVIARTPLSTGEDVARAVQSSRAAFPAWREVPPGERTRVLFRYRQLLEAEFDSLARLITREHGKTMEEACGDVRRGIEVVELACGIPMMLMGQALEDVGRGIDGTVTRRAVGVCAGITPFNFPAMVPMWMYPIAIACGNTFVLKPSPKVPLTALRLAELFSAAGLPPGVLNVVHGDKEAVDALLAHPDVAAVSFVGSTGVARYVHQTAAASGKRVQAAGGAKNYLVVMPDADPDAAAGAIMGAAFGCAGQRCMAGSVMIAVGDAGDRLVRMLAEAAARLEVGPTDEPGSTAAMGPLIDAAARERVLQYLDLGAREGAELITDGRQEPRLSGAGFFLGPSIFDRVEPHMRIAREEIFGPVLSVVRLPSLERAIECANLSPYGNGAVIFTGDGAAARKFTREIRCGMAGINVGVPAPMAFFPFSGWNQSFFGDLHMQGTEGIQFYTRARVVLSRWHSGGPRGTWS